MIRTAVSGKIAALFIAGAFVVASCGDDDDTDTATPESTSQEAATTVANATSAPAPTTAAAPSDIYGTPDTPADTESDTASDTSPENTPGATAAAGDEAIVTTASSSLGDVLVGEGGFTVYGFTPDAGGTPTCVDECAASWPPVLLNSADVPAGLDPDVFSVVEYPEGGFVLRAGEWPLYYFAGDRAAGDVNGQGVNGVWFAVDPTGTLIEE